MADFYELLGASRDAPRDDIDRAFRERLAELHASGDTDTGPGSRFDTLMEAHRTLSDPERRAGYDAALRSFGSASELRPEAQASAAAAEPAPEITTAFPPAAEKTTAFTPPQSPEPAVPSSKQLAEQLARRGLSPDEVRRMVRLHEESLPAPQTLFKPKPLKQEPYVPKPTLTFPAPREVSSADREAAEGLLRSAHLARKRGQMEEGLRHCRAALEKNPCDAGAFEMFGDLLQGVGQVDNALAAYRHAVELDPRQASAETKYADLVLLQNPEIQSLAREEYPGNPNLAALAGILPGMGHLYVGEVFKAIVLAGLAAADILLLMFSNLGFPGRTANITPSLGVLLGLSALLVVYSVVDAAKAAKGRRKTGWEV
jgi:curved DNA-binding protein CbpA